MTVRSGHSSSRRVQLARSVSEYHDAPVIQLVKPFVHLSNPIENDRRFREQFVHAFFAWSLVGINRRGNFGSDSAFGRSWRSASATA